MPRCFVIQPFDNGPYDKRYRDVLVPAIKEAGLDPYRVDKDPSTTVPIDDIENGIQLSEICLADITTDNPNIWYEVGFAFANGKPVVMICAKPRPTRTPFDIQHRQIISYTLDSPSDFHKLGKEVVTRLKAQLKKTEAMKSIASLSPVKSAQGLTSYEVAGMVSIMENRLTPRSAITPGDIRTEMRRAGYTDMATSLSLESLRRKGMIEFDEAEADDFGNTYTIVRLSDSGLDWMLENQDRFNLSVEEESTEQAPLPADEDIPF